MNNTTKENPFNTDLTLFIIILLVLSTTFIFLIYLLYSSSFSTKRVTNSNALNPTSQPELGVLKCAKNLCATSIITGNKRCPPEGLQIEYNAGFEVCNSKFACENRLTPYAGQSDGSSVLSGICQDGIECPCFSKITCANYITSVFTSSDGNIVNPLGGQRITFPQILATNISGNKVILNNPALNFCTVPISWLPISTPGCGFVTGGFSNNMNYDELKICMGQVRGCNNSFNSPCLSGTLAVISSDPDSLNQQNVIFQQMGCVAGESCPCDSIAVYDTNFGGIICKTLPIT